MINRCAVTVRAKRPFLDWLRSLPHCAEVSLADVNRDPQVYLLPEYGHDDELADLLADYYDLIFEEELRCWWTDEKDWPAERDFETFDKWFEVEFRSGFLDLMDAPPRRSGRG